MAPLGLLGDLPCSHISQLPTAVYLHHILMSNEPRIAKKLLQQGADFEISLLGNIISIV